MLSKSQFLFSTEQPTASMLVSSANSKIWKFLQTKGRSFINKFLQTKEGRFKKKEVGPKSILEEHRLWFRTNQTKDHLLQLAAFYYSDKSQIISNSCL